MSLKRISASVVLLLAAALIAAGGAGIKATAAHAAGEGQYSPPKWLPIRNPVIVGCVLSNCSQDDGSPYHGYWAIDLLDPANKQGAPIMAAGAGQVHIEGTGTGCGGPGTPANFLSVDHGGGVKSYYYHLDTFTVSNGQWVDENTKLGTMGSVGYTVPCPANHLHFEVRINGVRVDPGPLQACHGTDLVSYPDAAGITGGWNAFPFDKLTIYSDGTSCDGSSPPPSQAAVNTTVSSSANPSLYGQPVTLTASVAPQASNANTPTGTAQILDGATVIGSGALSSGSFSVLTSLLSIGTHSITASYGGDGNFLNGASAVLHQVVTKDPTTTTVASNVNPSVFGQPVKVTGSVTANPPGGGTPTGALQLFDGATPIGAGTLAAGQFSITASTLTVGVHRITAVYAGEDHFAASTSAVLNQVVNKAPTNTALTASPPGSVGFGHPVTFTAEVTVPPPGAGAPTGSVTFSVDGTPVQTEPLDLTLQARVTTSSLAPGSHLVQAAYAGDGNFLGSTGTVNYLVTCTVTITGNHPGSLIATGDSTCVVNGAIGGSITVPKETSLAIISSTVKGVISATNQPNAIEVCGSRFVGGSVSVINAGGLVIVGDPGDAGCAPNTIGGTLLLQRNTHGVEAIGNIVGGLVAIGNYGAGPFAGDATAISANVSKH